MRVLVRRDRFDRFVSILVYVPRERYDSAIRARLGAYFADVYKGRISAFYPFFPEGALTRVHFIIGRDEGATPDPDRADARGGGRKDRAQLGRRFRPGARRAITKQGRANALNLRYRDAFSAGYREAFAPEDRGRRYPRARIAFARAAGRDQFLSPESGAGRGSESEGWSFERPLPLSERVPVLEHMGFSVIDERTYTIEKGSESSSSAFLHDMTLARKGGGAIELEALDARLEAALMAVMSGRAESDGFNALVLAAGMAWRDVALVRALARYLRQAGVPYSQDYLWTTLTKHAAIAEKIVALFHARFDPRLAIEIAERAKKKRPLRPMRKQRSTRSKASMKTASCASFSLLCGRRSAPIFIRSTGTAIRKRRSRSNSKAGRSMRLPLAAAAL